MGEGDRVYMPYAFCHRGVVIGENPETPGAVLVAWLDQIEVTSHHPDELRVENHMSDWRGL